VMACLHNLFIFTVNKKVIIKKFADSPPSPPLQKWHLSSTDASFSHNTKYKHGRAA